MAAHPSNYLVRLADVERRRRWSIALGDEVLKLKVQHGALDANVAKSIGKKMRQVLSSKAVAETRALQRMRSNALGVRYEFAPAANRISHESTECSVQG